MTNPRSNKQNFFSQLNQHELKMMKVTLLCLATLLAAPVPGQGQLVPPNLGPGGTKSPPNLGPGGTQSPPILGPGGTQSPPILGPGGTQVLPPPPPLPSSATFVSLSGVALVAAAGLVL